MTVRGIEAIKLYIPTAKEDVSEIKTNVQEETGQVIVPESLTDKTMTSVERYRQEWTTLLANLDANPDRFRLAALNGDLKMSKFRSIYWALLLRVLNVDHRSWHIQRMQQRSRYEKFRVAYVRNPHELDVPADDNPLSQSTQSVWNQYFSDQELLAVIRQDVVRTFPSVDFFRKFVIQNAMTNILFYYAREHPYMCYRQGMHEVLAPIIFVIYSDHQSMLHFSEIAKTDINETLLNVLDPEYLESDAYSIFSRLMASVESYYRVSNLVPTAGGYVEMSVPANTDTELQSEVEVISQLNLIRDKILAKEDQHLHYYLLKMEIPLHIFGIRWLRLLFGREFVLLDLLLLWDAIFADSDRFDLPNYILVAMLVHIRDKLLLSDYTTSLTYLMRYPSNVDVNLVIRHALFMLNPKQFECPSNVFTFVSFTNNLQASRGGLPAVRPQHTTSQRSRTISDASTSASHIDHQITYLQKLNAVNSSALSKLGEVNRSTMDGYLENSPDLLCLELKNAQTVIKVARSKLQKYMFTVRKNVAKHSNEELDKALDGIEELCSFLDVKLLFPLQIRSAPIDQAHEANEQKQLSKATTSKAAATDISTSTTAPAAISSTYEMPENAFMQNSIRRLLGGLREIELFTIISDEKPETLVQNGLPAAEPHQRPQ